MRLTLISLGLLVAAAGAASAQIYHQGYFTRNGTYVAPHYQMAPNGTKLDNYSSYPNINPYTGQQGTVNPYAPPPVPQPYNPYVSPYAAP